jgi:hypothetical protein
MTGLFFTCNEKASFIPSESFNKIYNEPSFSDFQALDIVQMEDGGYLILGSVENSFAEQSDVPYVLRTDKEGNFLWDTKSDVSLAQYTSPIPNLRASQGVYHFFCVKKDALTPVVLRINDANKKVEEVRAYPQINGDLVYAGQAKDNGTLLTVLSEKCKPDNDLQTRNIEIFNLNSNFDVQWNKCYPYSIFIPRDPVSRKVNYNFFWNGNFNANEQDYYFATFLGQENSSVVMFTDTQGEVKGATFLPFVVNSISHITNNRFAMTFVRQRDTNIVINAQFELDSTTSPSIFGSTFHEINSQARTITKKMNLVNKEVVIIASTLENIPIRVYAFDAQVTTNDLLRGTLTLGKVNPYEIANIIPTADGGLAIVTNTLVGDRFRRIALLKVSTNETNRFVNSCLSTGTCRE